MSNIPAISGGAIAPVNVGALVKPLAPNPIEQLLTGVAQLPENVERAKAAKLATQQQELQTQSMQQQVAQNGWDMTGKILLGHPEWATNPPPDLSARVSAYAQQLGIPDPVGADGSIDTTVWKTPWSALAPDQQRMLTDDALSRPAGPARDALYSAYSGVPDSLRTAQVSLSPKDMAAITRASAYAQHDANLDQATGQRIQIQQYLAAHQGDLDDARVVLYKNEAQAATMNASASVSRAQAALQDAATRSNSYQLQLRKFELNPNPSGQSNLRLSATALLNENTKLGDQSARLNAALSSAVANNADQSVIDAIGGQLKQINGMQAQLKTQTDAANALLTENLGDSTHVQASSGARRVTVSGGSGGVAPQKINVNSPPPGARYNKRLKLYRVPDGHGGYLYYDDSGNLTK